MNKRNQQFVRNIITVIISLGILIGIPYVFNEPGLLFLSWIPAIIVFMFLAE